MGVLEKGVPQGSIIGPSVANVILSKTFPKRVFKTVGKERKYVWVENYSYADDILIIGNHSEEFKDYIQTFKSSLSKVGLSVNFNKTKIYHKVKSKINFYFLGFEFIIMPRNLLSKTRLFSNLGNLNQLKNGQKGFAIILKPKSDKLLEIKKKLKQAISRIHRVSRPQLFKVFQQYEKYIGRSVNVYLKEGKKILGKILNANKGEGITLETTTSKKIGNKKKQIIEQQSISFDEIDRTKVVISF